MALFSILNFILSDMTDLESIYPINIGLLLSHTKERYTLEGRAVVLNSGGFAFRCSKSVLNSAQKRFFVIREILDSDIPLTRSASAFTHIFKVFK